MGISTPSADYYLTKGSDDYQDIFESIDRKVLLSKIVVEYLNEAKETRDVIEYDDLLSHAEAFLPTSCSAADEIIKHSKFILTQVSRIH